MEPFPYIATRFPYTYAADYLRKVNPNISRGEASLIRKLVAEAAGIPDDVLAEILATEYMSENNITRPEESA
jgi:hypothetical protein